MHYPKISLVFLSSLFVLISPFSSLAASFNPANIISDEELQDVHSLGRAEIRTFLQNRGSALSDLILEDFEGKNRYSSDIIYKAAQNYQINPKYLLVKLQKEQSLITSKNPTQRQLDWATGYGACDSCDTTDPKLEKYKGFGKQVDNAAGIMRWYYDHMNEEAWIKKPNTTYTIDETEITPANQATAFLYTYTPHLHGNENFWKLWNTWFEQVYPEGTLVKATNDPTVYAIIDGTKRAIKNMSVLASRFDPKMLVTVSPEELARYKNGPVISFPNYSLLKVNDVFYLLDDNTARPFASAEVFRQFGYNPDELLNTLENDLEGYTIGDAITLEELYPTGRLVTIPGSASLYYLKNTHYFSVAPEIAAIRFPKLKPQKISVDEFVKLESSGSLLFPDATLVGSKLSKNVYVIEKGQKRLIPSEKVFLQLGYKWSNVIWVDDITLSQHANGEALYTEVTTENKSTSTPKLELTAAKKIIPKKTVIKKAVPKVIVKKSASKPVVKKPLALFFTPPTSTEPIMFREIGSMYAVTPTLATWFGPRFSTPIDSYVIAKIDDGVATIIAEKNADVQRPLASLTKVLSSYQMVNDSIDLDTLVEYNPKIHQAPSGYLYKIAAGDVVQNKDLMNALLVSSFNTPALMLVDSMGKNQAEFVEEMNDFAKNLNLKKTYFFDPHGYDVRNQGSAREYITIFNTALTNPIIRSYLAEKSYSYTEVVNAGGVSKHSDINTNRLFFSKDAPYTIRASKTGFLYEAGYNMAMLVERNSDGQKFMVIALGNPYYDKKYSEPDRLTRWALKNF